jgi:hypothetical protein
MLLFYTGAEAKNPTYRRGILDGLSYPSGHMLNFSYRRQYIQPALLERDLSGQAAVIVYVDLDAHQNPTYMPIRVVNIVTHSPFRGAAERERIPFTFCLGDFVSYSGQDSQKNLHSQLELLDSQRKVDGHFRFFVIEAELRLSSSASATAWEDVVTAVGRSSQLRNAIFVKLELKNLDGP